MKKLLSMLLVVAMIASMSLVAFAADTNTMSVEIVETDADITVTYYITNPANVSGFTAALNFPSAKVFADKNTAYTLGADFAAAAPSTGSKPGYVKFGAAYSDPSKYVTKSGKVEAVSYKLTRVDADAVLTSAEFKYSTGLYLSKIGLGDGSQLDNSATADNFVAPVYVDNRTPVTPPQPEVDAAGATESEINAKQDWTSGEFKYPTDKVGGTDTAAVGKKVAAFGKANVGLTAGNYGVKIGNRYYPGKWDVPADSLFAIIVVNTDGDDAIEGSYTYSIYTGNAESNPTIIVENLPAVVK